MTKTAGVLSTTTTATLQKL